MAIIIGYITTSGEKESRKIAMALLKKRLIACANIIPEVESRYWWNGKIEKQKESILLVKTQEKKITEIVSEVKQIHSYKVPGIEFWPAAIASLEFEKWVMEETK
jgi:periplasmic divalent cation tolerance protein